MSDVHHLLAEYIAEHRSGGAADPQAYLSRASPPDRAELMTLIDAYLARAPRQAFDDEGYRRSSAERAVDELERALRGQSGLWPALLPQLRHRAGLKRSELVERLAAALGVGDKSTKVGDYYHQMERGLLSSSAVSDRVLTALGQLLGESARALREAGSALRAAEPGVGAAATAFARRTYTDASTTPAPAGEPGPDAVEWDEVDELFRGG